MWVESHVQDAESGFLTGQYDEQNLPERPRFPSNSCRIMPRRRRHISVFKVTSAGFTEPSSRGLHSQWTRYITTPCPGTEALIELLVVRTAPVHRSVSV